MAKLIVFILKVLLILAFLVVLVEPAKGQTVRQKATTAYLSQVGVRERTGRNDGVEVEAYLRSVGLGKGYPWCAAFTNWCLLQAGGTPPKSGYVPVWFPKDKIVYRQGKEVSRMPLRGDTFGIYFRNMGRLAHIGFVHTWGEGKYVTTIEGNTGPDGGRDGDGVYRKYRLKSQVHSVSNWINE
jgi:hypothetical protein